MHHNDKRTEEPNTTTTTTTSGEAVNLQGIKTHYYGSCFLIKGFQMGEILTLGQLIWFCRHAM
jgi:hypothetical protein